MLVAPRPRREENDIEPVLHETRDRITTGTVTVVPFIALGIVGWQVWNDLLHWSDVAVFLIMYLITGLGVTVGFHRHLTHRAFKTKPGRCGGLAIMGSGDRRARDRLGGRPPQAPRASPTRRVTPTAPTSATRAAGAARSRASSTRMWAGSSSTRTGATRRATRPDLIRDPLIRLVDRTFVVWVVGRAARLVRARLADRRLARRRAHRPAVGRRGADARGAPRDLQHQLALPLLRRQDYETADHSRNLLWLAPFTFGEAWHNNHHAFPTSAFHGLQDLAVRPVRHRDPRARAARPRVGRPAREPRASG